MSDIKIVEETLEYRLKQVIKTHYGTQKKMSEDLKISRTVVSDWWAGRTKPTTTILQKICEKTGVSMDWLVLGRAEPYIKDEFFEEIFNESKKFAEKNKIKFDAMYLLGMQRIITAEKRMNIDITLEKIFRKYKEIILTFRKK